MITQFLLSLAIVKRLLEIWDEDQLRRLSEILDRLRSLNKRRQSILKSINEQGKLNSELEKRFDVLLPLKLNSKISTNRYRPKSGVPERASHEVLAYRVWQTLFEPRVTQGKA